MPLLRWFGFANYLPSSTVQSSKPRLCIVIMYRLCICHVILFSIVTKHIEIDIHFVREKVALGEVRVLHVPTSAQFADIFTKGLLSAAFLDIRSSLNVVDAAADTAGGGGGGLDCGLGLPPLPTIEDTIRSTPPVLLR